ncbi:MAG: 16S rRNA pseudouridine(516) synthase [Firmicutes bacterium HGW-Firmicutes-20]|jgi:16S rRNA pseudouridine516 synthase|nr:MAG: 16S rRNA pseudouridine(516) synthase [Firmicutes bacterium HGW-Firmicutes-20]PKM88885.1 MAG: 16S rRNA pseudouridine(516) synthase [Firmicutes bacterium HGW-Firmicutes-10]
MRLDKYLSIAGIGSRKDVKKIIRQKRVTVNGVISVNDDVHIDPYLDEIRVDQQILDVVLDVYIMLNKPQGVVSATSDDLHKTVLECIDVTLPPGCFPVGRLDIDTEGLLLITNDGDLSHRLLSPKRKVDKTYYLECRDTIDDKTVDILRSGVDIDDETLTLPAEVELLSEVTMNLTIKEGRYHQIKRMLAACGNQVTYLKRIKMGSLNLDDDLALGQWRFLSESEVEQLKKG